MPVKVKALACKFRCGFTRIGLKKAIVEKHEDRCRLNPKNRACTTCLHDEITFSDDLKYYQDCPEFPDDGWIDPDYIGAEPSQLMRRNCPKWYARPKK